MIALALLLAATRADPFVGTWEGTSLCQVRPSACRDEHVIYRVSALGPGRYHFVMTKLIAGKEQPMADLDLATSKLDRAAISGTTFDRAGRPATWTFTPRRNHMSGSATVGPQAQIFRVIQLTKR